MNDEITIDMVVKELNEPLPEERCFKLFFLSDIEEKVVSMMEHALGMDNRKIYHRHKKAFYKAYRNYYDAGGVDVVYWDALVKVGFATKQNMYHITDKGIEWLGKRIDVYIKEDE